MKSAIIKEITSWDSCFVNIGAFNADDKECWLKNKKMANFELSEARPYLVYNEFCVFFYEKDEKFYFVDEEQITEVIPTHFMCANSMYQYFDNDKQLSDEDLHKLHDNFCCGEFEGISQNEFSFSAYIWFDKAEIKRLFSFDYYLNQNFVGSVRRWEIEKETNKCYFGKKQKIMPEMNIKGKKLSYSINDFRLEKDEVGKVKPFGVSDCYRIIVAAAEYEEASKIAEILLSVYLQRRIKEITKGKVF